jgi:hypothetical protein
LALAGGCQHADIRFDPAYQIHESGWELPASACSDGHVLFVSETKGLFPGALSVARVRPAASEPAASGSHESSSRWSVWALNDDQATYWNNLMTDVPQVREVVAFQKWTTPRDEVELRDLAAAAMRRRTDLCFAYGVVSDDPQCYRMSGLLFQTSTGARLAAVGAQAGPENFQLPSGDRPHHDLRHCDPSYLCARKLEANVRTCLLDLIDQDKAVATQPSPWMGEGPLPPPPEMLILPH